VLPDIRSQTRETLAAQFNAWGQPSYRLDQLLGWLYARRAASWDAMSNLPKALREQLAATWSLHLPELVVKQGSRDTTQKFLWRLADGALIESVLIPANPALYGEDSDRHTLCISTQVGCAYGCRFCASGLEGWKRNLTISEIVGQILAVERWAAANPPESPTPASPSAEAAVEGSPAPAAKPAAPAPSRIVNNIVVMGMGEPMANFDNLMPALRTLNAAWGCGIGARKITISTSGLAPRIRDLARDPLQFRLAISLHGATDAVRGQIMPVNRKYPLAELTAACEDYVRHKGKMITLEYILIAGVNDGLDQVMPLADLAHRLHAKVNLIPYNKVDGLPWERPTDDVCETFADQLDQQEVVVTLRREKGHDIDAACGQLRLKTEKKSEETASTPPPAA
jgi:23S rRNA (adenine2503-C2)-methyltransferase